MTRRRPDVLPEFRVRRLPARGTVRFALKQPAHAPLATAADKEAKFLRNPDHVAAAIAAGELEDARLAMGRKLTRSESAEIIRAAIRLVGELLPLRRQADAARSGNGFDWVERSGPHENNFKSGTYLLTT